MAETTVSEEVNIEDANLLTTPIATPTSAPPSDPADPAKDEGADTKADPVVDPAKDADGTEAKAEPPKAEDGKEDPAKPADPTEDPANKEEAPKVDPDRARQEYLNRQRTKQNVQQQIDQIYAPKTEEELVEEGLSRGDAQIQALREEMAFKEQRAQIAEMNAGLQVDAVNVLNDFPIFNPDSPEYDEAFTNMVQQQYQTAARLQADQNGIVLNAEVPLYDFHKQMADIYSRGRSNGAQKGQQDALQVLAAVENPGGSSSANNPSSDSLADLEERLGDTVIT